MPEKEFVGWYELPKDVRNKLAEYGNEFIELRHSGSWERKAFTGLMDGKYPIMRFRANTLYYDATMPRIKSLMDKEIKVQICAINFNTLQVSFVFPEALSSVQPACLAADHQEDRKKRGGGQ